MIRLLKRKKKNKKKKNKNKSIQQQQNELLKQIDIKIPETQEDIDAWIAERKRKFPTRRRIEEKEQNNQAREERGALDLSEKANKERRKQQKKTRNDSRPLEMPTNRPTKIPSILDKITQDEERKNHSIVLQCFRYFVKHNFLQDEFDPSAKLDDNSYYSSEYYSDEEANSNQNSFNGDDDNDNN